MTLLLSRTQTEGLLDLESTVDLVRTAFDAFGRDEVLDPQRVHVGAPGGGFHVVVGGVTGLDTGPADVPGAPAAVFAAKINASFEPGPGQGGLKLVGLIVLSDAIAGDPLAVMDSRAVTMVRTAAVTTVALEALARPDARTLVLVGAGRQAAQQVVAARLALPNLERVAVWSPTAARRDSLVDRLSHEHSGDGMGIAAAEDLSAAVGEADVVVTVTPARGPLFPADAVRPGTTVVALGSDGPGKQELDPQLLSPTRGTLVVPDVTAQCATSGELAHGLAAGVLSLDDVAAQLGEVVAGTAAGRTDDTQIVVFDSTGTAMQDVAAALAVYRSATADGIGTTIDFTA